MRTFINMFLFAFLFASVITSCVAAWTEPYFENAGTAGVDFGGSDHFQEINVDEEIKWPFDLARINYEGEGIPTLGGFSTGDNGFLNAEIKKRDNTWYIVINSRQDYENQNQREYIFSIFIKTGNSIQSESHMIFMTVRNIFDNSPTVSYSPSPCRAEELKADYLTECVFLVRDEDGMDGNVIRLEVSGKNKENEFFDFVEIQSSNVEYEKEFKLRIINELHYEERAIYDFKVIAYDVVGNSGIALTILEVIDIPNMDPIWVTSLASATFPEKQAQTFTIRAIDGDTGINKPICYRLEFNEDYSNLMSVGNETGILDIKPIDRDTLKQEMFQFYTCAYKCDNTTWAIKNPTILIVQDINDHYPEIEIVPEKIAFLEATYLTVPFEKFIVSDIDLGINATYNVALIDSGITLYSQAFDLIPNAGYQTAHFRLTVRDSRMLDYEIPAWRKFTLTIQTQEVETLEHLRTRELQVELLNWNDELPIFDKPLYNISVLETLSGGQFLETVRAFDRDIDDSVIHEIVGHIHGISIDKETGDISTTRDNAFDYERQITVILQIMAQDTLTNEHSQELHSAFTQLTINVIDVNDETPTIRMPRTTIEVAENTKEARLLTDQIEGHDPDTNATMVFDILWEKSYATKAGQEAAKSDYKNCFTIEGREVSRNLVYGHLKVNRQFTATKDIDYEKYDTMYLTIKVTDIYQEVNEDSSEEMITIHILDENDNAPEFIENTLSEPRHVIEMADDYTLIGNVLAIDIDGPGNNIITYEMKPAGELTQPGLVDINSTTGFMRVAGSIDCDVPKIYFLEYQVILRDGVHTTTGEIKIAITDINNKVPRLLEFDQTIEIWEDAKTGTLAGKVRAVDDDRDEPHNLLAYSINYAVSNDLQNLFQINTETGQVSVNLKNGVELDRDNGVENHNISITIEDNYLGNGPSFQVATYINVVLKDVNDNAPEMPSNDLFKPEFSEDALEGVINEDRIIAPDKDEPNTPNSWVSYKINSIKPGAAVDIAANGYEDLFGIIGDDKVYGQLTTRKSLRGFHGTWLLNISAFDHGEPQQMSTGTYEVVVKPYNFNAPKIVFPVKDKPIRLCYDLQEVNRPLYSYEADCSKQLRLFEAFDPDGGIFGDVRFELSSNIGDDKNFTMVKDIASKTKSMLQIKQKMPAGIYKVNVRAVDGGGKTSEEIHDLKVVFVDTHGNPIFKNTNFSTSFTETEIGLSEENYLPPADDPKNEGIENENDKFKIFYFIDVTYRPEDAQLFTLHKETGLLRLAGQELDRLQADTHYIKVKATNDENGSITNSNSVNNTLLVTITVNDVNNHAPTFDERSYAAGITDQDTRGKVILKVHATDPDLDDPTRYVIKSDSIETHGENIEAHKSNMFELDSETGVLTLTSLVRSTMKGYFIFTIVALDTFEPEPHSDEVQLKLYIIAEVNRVTFLFMNAEDLVKANEAFLRERFQELYGYDTCNIDDVVQQIPEASSQARAGNTPTITEVRAHFINDNEAVEAIEIQRKSNDLAFSSQLRSALLEKNLVLHDVPSVKFENAQNNLEGTLTTTLIIVTLGLTTICTGLVIAYVLKAKAVNRQLKAFAPSEFGSQVSHMKGMMGAPTTNMFSKEGSNPVVNIKSGNKVLDDFDESSIYSDESDFVGINNDPTFMVNKPRMSEVRNNNIMNIVHRPTLSSISDEDGSQSYDYDQDSTSSSTANEKANRF